MQRICVKNIRNYIKKNMEAYGLRAARFMKQKDNFFHVFSVLPHILINFMRRLSFRFF
jgi:hypothetical protein